jgi:hypothetical protein
MSQKEFLKICLLCLIGSQGLQATFSLIFPLYTHIRFAIFCLLFFTGVLIMSFYVGRALAKATLKTAFTGFAMGIILLKLLASIGIVVGYTYSMQPDNNYYVLIFALYYLIFTIGEVHILMRLSKSTA